MPCRPDHMSLPGQGYLLQSRLSASWEAGQDTGLCFQSLSCIDSRIGHKILSPFCKGSRLYLSCASWRICSLLSFSLRISRSRHT